MGRNMKAATSEARTLVSHPELKSHKSFPSFRTGGEPPRGPLERFLSFFADVRAGEGTGALLMMVAYVLLPGVATAADPLRLRLVGPRVG